MFRVADGTNKIFREKLSFGGKEKRKEEETEYLVCVDRLGFIIRVVDVRVLVI